jgi:hypothetical protein
MVPSSTTALHVITDAVVITAETQRHHSFLCFTCLVSEYSDQIKSSMAMTTTLGRWSLIRGTSRMTYRLSSTMMAIAAHRQLALLVAVVVWFNPVQIK